MKVLLVDRVVEFVDPLQIELLSALARAKGHATFLSILAQDDLEDDFREVRPDLVAISSKTGEHTEFLKAARRIKAVSPDTFIILGGPHPTFDPRVITDPYIDAICVGEGDHAWPEFLDAFDRGGNINGIKNILTKENFFRKEAAQHGNLTQIQPEELTPFIRPRSRTLDHLPFFDREIVYSKTHLKTWPMISFMTSWGCPFQCTYCFEPIQNRLYAGTGSRPYNRFSVDRVLAELKEATTRYKKQFVKFYDDMFFIRWNDWMEEFCEKYPKEVGLPFFCLTRCDVVCREGRGTLEKLRAAGLHSITMSIEAGNEYIRNEIFKRHMTREEIRKAFDWCFELGIVTFCNTIFGIPVTKEKMAKDGKTAIDYDIESLDINIESRVSYATYPILFPYEMTDISRYTIDIGAFDGNYDALYHGYEAESPFRGWFTDKELLMQKNLSMLGTVVTMFPRLRNITVKYLIKLPLSSLYFIPYFFTKAYLNAFEVYPTKMTLMTLFRKFVIALKLEWIKRDPRRKKLYKKQSDWTKMSEQTLGGAPPKGQSG